MRANNIGGYNDIIDRIVSVDGLYEKVFGKLLDLLIYDVNIDNDIHLLKHVYKFNDADEVFRRKIDSWKFHRITKTIFRFNETSKDDEPQR